MALHDQCIPEAFLCDLEPADKEDAIRQLVDALVGADVFTTRKGNAIAKEVIPHARTKAVDRVILTFGRVAGGFDFAATDGRKVNVICLLLTPAAAADDHLAAMKSIVAIVRDNYQCKRLIGCKTPESFIGLLKELDGVKS